MSIRLESVIAGYMVAVAAVIVTVTSNRKSSTPEFNVKALLLIELPNPEFVLLLTA